MKQPKFSAWEIAALERLVENALTQEDVRFDQTSLKALLNKLRAS